VWFLGAEQPGELQSMFRPFSSLSTPSCHVCGQALILGHLKAPTSKGRLLLLPLNIGLG